MYRNSYRVLGVAGVFGLALWLSGCGGGGGGGDNNLPGAAVQVSIRGAQWIGFQDGANGAWQTLAGAGDFNGAPRVTAADGRYSLAYVCGGAKPTVHVVHTTVSEAPQLNAVCGGSSTPSTITVNGTVQGLEGGQALIAIGESTAVSVAGTYTISSMPAGTYDVVAVRLASGTPNRVWLQRGRTFTTSTTYDINFNQTDGSLVRVFDVSSGTLTIAGIDTGANENITAQVSLQSAVRSSIIGLGVATQDGAVIRYPMIPNTVLSAGESFRVRLISDAGRGIEEVVASLPSSQNYTLPAPFSNPSFSVNSTGAIVVDVVGFDYSESPVRGYLLDLSGDGQPARYQILISRSWLGSANRYSTPVLSNLSGWNASWTLQRGQPLNAALRVLVVPNTVPTDTLWLALQGGNPPAGFQLRYATRNASLNP
ncbi:MAG: hypothetical protein KatS3mg016_1159 [Fimbriimonadales bacterium]|nr:MAG: hypothetical protein KatS3mg016_1159 [Fimbriimonadales bacterium]